jgi:hypothetical protein
MGVVALAMVATMGLVDRVRLKKIAIPLGARCEGTKVLVKDLQLGFAEIFDVDQSVARAVKGGDDFVEFELNREPILVLGALNEKHHQKGDDGGAGVDHQLPRIRIVEDRPADDPGQEHEHRHRERPRAAGPSRGPGGDSFETATQLGLRTMWMAHAE